MLATQRREPHGIEILASPLRAELCTIIVSFFDNQETVDPIVPIGILHLSWCSYRVRRFTLRFRQVLTPSVADSGISGGGTD